MTCNWSRFPALISAYAKVKLTFIRFTVKAVRITGTFFSNIITSNHCQYDSQPIRVSLPIAIILLSSIFIKDLDICHYPSYKNIEQWRNIVVWQSQSGNLWWYFVKFWTIISKWEQMAGLLLVHTDSYKKRHAVAYTSE